MGFAGVPNSDPNSFRYGHDDAAKQAIIRSRVSRCQVVEAPGMVTVLHSQSAFVPNCPLSYERVYSGYSFTGVWTSFATTAKGQDLGSTGSCLPKFISKPVMECDRNSCRYHTRHDRSGWLTTRDYEPAQWNTYSGDAIPITDFTDIRDMEISRCSVCLRRY